MHAYQVPSTKYEDYRKDAPGHGQVGTAWFTATPRDRVALATRYPHPSEPESMLPAAASQAQEVWPLAGSLYKHMHTYRRTLPQLKIIAAACMGQSQPKRHATKWLATLGQGY